jgi:CheY-like chemotaxis protein
MTHHILVVDDDRSIRTMVSLVLESEGYPVTTAANGAEALQEIERELPSAMLLDMQMPVLDGWGVARRLREQGRRVPTVVMTAASTAARWCAEIAAEAFLAKPFDIDDLVRAVQQVRTPMSAEGC